MLRPVLLTACTAALLLAGSVVADGRDAIASPRGSTERAALQAGAPTRDSLQDAVAAAVIGSVSRQFDSDDVTVKLDEVRVVPASIQDQEVQGTGRLRLDGDPQWIPFRFVVLYDTQSAEVTYPRLQLGETTVAQADPALTRSLSERVDSALATEFEGQPVRWAAGKTTVSSASDRFVRVSARGEADFGVEGRVPAIVEGLYDRRDARWVRVNYELGGEDQAPAAIVASL
jgi:hypothetical protein